MEPIDLKEFFLQELPLVDTINYRYKEYNFCNNFLTFASVEYSF